MFKAIKRMEGLPRDKDGHRRAMKLLIKVERPMKPESWERWGICQRSHISKHKLVQVPYSSTKQIGLPDGIPIQYMLNNDTMVKYLMTKFSFQPGEKYSLYGWRRGRGKHPSELTKQLAVIVIHDEDKPSYEVTKDARLRRYWFRRQNKKQEEGEEDL